MLQNVAVDGLSECAGTERKVTNQMVIVKILCKIFFKISEYEFDATIF